MQLNTQINLHADTNISIGAGFTLNPIDYLFSTCFPTINGDLDMHDILFKTDITF